MPELPEVETIRFGLQRLLPGRQIISESHDWAREFPNSESDVKAFLIGAKVREVTRRAKVLIISLSSGYSLVIHLRMTGQLVFVGKDIRLGGGHPNQSLISKLPDRSTRVILTFDDQSVLYFNDQRKFGYMKLYPSSQVEDIKFIKNLGPEPLEEAFTWQSLRDNLERRKNTSIKAALLDQTVVSGIGNIYADEALWLARIHPARLVKSMSTAEIKKLHKSIVEVLSLSISHGGSSDRNYINAEGKRGSYLEYAKVFRREGQNCYRCGNEIIKTRVAGRGTHICLNCQKPPTRK